MIDSETNHQTIQASIQALEAAMASGVLEVEVGDQKTRYRSVSDIQRAIRYYKQKRLAIANASPPILLGSLSIRSTQTHKGLVA